MVRLLIAGIPRCGTTLLAGLLNQQPGCRFVMDEIRWMRAASKALSVGWSQPLTLAQRRACLTMARADWIRLKHPVLVGVSDFRSLDELQSGICEELARSDEVAIGHKAVLDPAQIREVVEQSDVQVIVAVRDPRAAAMSWWHRAGSGVEPYLRELKAVVRLCLQTRAPNFTWVRYEDLVMTPGRELDRIVKQWGGEPILPRSLTFELGAACPATPWNHNSAFEDVSRVLDPSAMDRWRASADSAIVRYANEVCQREIRALGYQPLEQRLHDRLRFRAHEAYWVSDGWLDAKFQSLRGALRRRLAPPLRPDDADRDAHGPES